MPYKDLALRKQKNKEANKNWYQRNKEKHQQTTLKNKREYRQLWMEFKAAQDCTFCGFSHPAVIDFHHVIRTEPKFSVHKLAKNSSYKRALEEIKKCIPLCANCHRILHWQENQDAKDDRKKRRKKKKKTGNHP